MTEHNDKPLSSTDLQVTLYTASQKYPKYELAQLFESQLVYSMFDQLSLV